MQENYLANWIQVCRIVYNVSLYDLCVLLCKWVKFMWIYRHCLIHCLRRITKMECWCWEVMVDTLIAKLHRLTFLECVTTTIKFQSCVKKNALFLICSACCFLCIADNYQNCCWKWCWENSGWKVSFLINWFFLLNLFQQTRGMLSIG